MLLLCLLVSLLVIAQNSVNAQTSVQLIDGSTTPLLDVSGAPHSFVGDIKPGAQLQGAFLYMANLANADLRDVNLMGAVLHSANLTGANLTGASLRRADLTGVDLMLFQLEGVDLREVTTTTFGTVLTREGEMPLLDLSGKLHSYGGNLRPNAQLQGADLVGAQLQGSILAGAQLQGANLTGVQLRDVQLQGANLAGAQLQEAQMQVAQLQGANLTEAQLQGTQLEEADLAGAKLQGANLTAADLSFVSMDRVDLTGADLTWARIFASSWIFHDVREICSTGTVWVDNKCRIDPTIIARDYVDKTDRDRLRQVYTSLSCVNVL